MSQTPPDARFWDRVARKYATDPIKDMAGYERTVARTLECLNATDHVLELGCGTGTTALRLAPRVMRYIATDISSEMIAIAREKVAALPCDKLELAAVQPDPSSWPAGPFDVVLAFNVLHLVPDRRPFLSHVRAMLKPDGRFITKTPCLSEMNRLIRLAVPIAKMLGKAPRVAFFTGRELVDEIAAAGFRVEEQTRHGTKPNEPRIFIAARR